MSDKTKHTPGPWASRAEVAGVIYGPDGYQVCTTPRTTRRETERDANARLIAAAPDLLAALRDVTDQLDAIGIPEWHGAEGLCLKQARLAIAQATGQEVTS